MSAKPTLILVPGLLCDAELWQAQSTALGTDFEVRIADTTGADSMAGFAQAVLETAPERFALAGLSMGGYIVQEVLRQAPERVSHVAMVDTNARADTPEQSENRKRMMGIAEAGGLDKVVAEMLPNLIHPDHLAVPEIADAFGRMAARLGVAAFLRQQTAIMNRIDGRPFLADIAVPTLILCGEQDALTPVKVHEEMADGIGDPAELVVIPDCGHLSTLEKPDAVNAAMRRWLARKDG